MDRSRFSTHKRLAFLLAGVLLVLLGILGGWHVLSRQAQWTVLDQAALENAGDAHLRSLSQRAEQCAGAHDFLWIGEPVERLPAGVRHRPRRRPQVRRRRLGGRVLSAHHLGRGGAPGSQSSPSPSGSWSWTRESTPAWPPPTGSPPAGRGGTPSPRRTPPSGMRPGTGPPTSGTASRPPPWTPTGRTMRPPPAPCLSPSPWRAADRPSPTSAVSPSTISPAPRDAQGPDGFSPVRARKKYLENPLQSGFGYGIVGK